MERNQQEKQCLGKEGDVSDPSLNHTRLCVLGEPWPSKVRYRERTIGLWEVNFTLALVFQLRRGQMKFCSKSE